MAYSSGRKYLEKLGIVVPDVHAESENHQGKKRKIEDTFTDHGSVLSSFTASEKALLQGAYEDSSDDSSDIGLPDESGIDSQIRCENWIEDVTVHYDFDNFEDSTVSIESSSVTVPLRKTDQASHEVRKNSAFAVRKIVNSEAFNEGDGLSIDVCRNISVPKTDDDKLCDVPVIFVRTSPLLPKKKTISPLSQEIGDDVSADICGNVSPKTDQLCDTPITSVRVDSISSRNQEKGDNLGDSSMSVSTSKNDHFCDISPVEVPSEITTIAPKTQNKGDDLSKDICGNVSPPKTGQLCDVTSVRMGLVLPISLTNQQKGDNLGDRFGKVSTPNTDKVSDTTPVEVTPALANSGNILRKTQNKDCDESLHSPKKRTRIVLEEGHGSWPLFFEEEISDSGSNHSSISAPVDTESAPTNPEQNKATPASTQQSSSTNSSNQKTKNINARKNTRRRLFEVSSKKKRKEAYNSGLEYTTEKGVYKPARKMRPGCKLSCKKCQSPRLSQESRQNIFDEFWALKSSVQRWDYLSRRVTAHAPKSCHTLPERTKKSIKIYTLKNEGEQVKVCKTMFQDTLSINGSWVDTALRKVDLKGNITPEKRGSHVNRPNKTTEEQIQSVHRHLDTIERVPSHYCREGSKREYFEAGLNFKRLYKMYLEWAKDVKEKEIATYSMYHEIFMTSYNIGFHKPKKDLCFVCSQWKNSTMEERRDMVGDYLKHLKTKRYLKKLREDEKEDAKLDPKFCLACFDLEKVLTCPRSEISIMYYLTKLSLYNFTVLDLVLGLGFCFMWNETVAGRGANEIASNLLAFISEMFLRGKKVFSFYSDSPTGQNRNRMVFSLWLYAALKYDIDITHRFFESGHSFSEVDHMHSRVETEATGKEIFHPDQWIDLILNAKQSGEPFLIKNLTQENCWDFHKLVDKMVWKNDTDNLRVKWTAVRQVRVDHKIPNTIFFKYAFEEAEKKIIVNPAENGFEIKSYELERAYTSHLPLAPKKAKDLMSMVEKRVVPPQYREFYKNLPGM